jgi:hypothetical protein
MTDREELDRLWNIAIRESVEAGELYARYRFAAIVAAAEREACAKLCEALGSDGYEYNEVYPGFIASEIRARGNK